MSKKQKLEIGQMWFDKSENPFEDVAIAEILKLKNGWVKYKVFWRNEDGMPTGRPELITSACEENFRQWYPLLMR